MRESKFFRFILALGLATPVFGWSETLFGSASEQAWWGPIITILLATAGGILAWLKLRVFWVEDAPHVK